MAKITITQIVDRWMVSRPTIMKAVKNGKVSGEKNDKGRWIFDVNEVVRWRGEPTSPDYIATILGMKVNSKSNISNENPLQAETIDILRAQVQQLDDHLKIKDNQIEKLQETLRDHTKLLEHQAKPGRWKRIFG